MPAGAPDDGVLSLAGDLREVFASPRWARRAARLAAVALLSAAAIMTGRMVGRMGQGTRTVHAIAPTGSQARPQGAATEVRSWPLAEPGAGRR
jgi:hypothetical protein